MQKYPARVAITLDTTTSHTQTSVTGAITYADGATATYRATVDNGTPMDVMLADIQDFIKSNNQHWGRTWWSAPTRVCGTSCH